MSHVATISMELKDLDSLASACKALGLELVRGQETYRWYGRSVGDYPLPEGFTAAELGHCEHAIRIPGNNQAYEVGVVKRRDGKQGYTLLWDFYHGGFGMEERVGKDGIKLRREYSAAVSANQLRKEGYRVEYNRQTSGKIVLRATR